MKTAEFCRMVDDAFDRMLARLECADGSDAALIAHWQEGSRPGYRLQVTRKADGKSLTAFIAAEFQH